jgi:phosphonate transport system permease protein
MSAAETRRAFKPNWAARIGWLAVAVYCVVAIWSLEITWDRFVIGLANGANFWAA